jgi:hypothetical protein
MKRAILALAIALSVFGVAMAPATAADSDGPDIDLAEHGLDWDGGILGLSEYGFGWEGGLLDLGDDADGIDDREFTVLERGGSEPPAATVTADDATDQVVVEGTIVGSDLCTDAALESATYDGEVDSLDVVVGTTSRDSGACGQTTNPIEYRVTFDIDGDLPDTVDITHLDQDGNQQFSRTYVSLDDPGGDS